MTDYGIYPPINILNSASRVMGDVTTKEHVGDAMKFKKMFSLLKENEVLIRIGAYTQGSDPELDEAIMKKELMNEFLGQAPDIQEDFEQTLDKLHELVL
jgi:flagellum-specific ATP synthase